MKIIYATSELAEWMDLAKEMQDTEGWEPVYWVTSPKNEEDIQKRFPHTYCQNYIDAIRGDYRAIDAIHSVNILDKEIISQYSAYEKVALKMMDRMDPTGYSFNHSERVQLYYDFLLYWVNMIQFLKADYVLFSESPHSLFQYILYAVCKENGVKILRFTPTHIEGLTFLSSTISNNPQYLLQKIKSMPKEGTISKAYLLKNRGEYAKALPYYMKEIKAQNTGIQKFKIYVDKLKRLKNSRLVLAYKKSAGYALSEGNVSKIDLFTYKVKGLWIKSKRKKEYESLVEESDLNQNYIYVALHYQPEKTTSPEGDIFTDQWLMVQMLTYTVPKGWLIYVKEHSSQFAEKLYGEQGRNHDFYRHLLKFKNVRLLSSTLNSFELIDNANAVATVTGTVGLESAIRSKAVLSFGYAWYAPCEGIFTIKNHKDLSRALLKIEEGYALDNEKVDAFLYAIESIATPCYLNPGNKSGVNFGREDNIHNLLTCLRQYLKEN